MGWTEHEKIRLPWASLAEYGTPGGNGQVAEQLQLVASTDAEP